jgi:hypothetical protein
MTDNTALVKALAELIDLLQIVAESAAGYRVYLLDQGFDKEVADALSTGLLMEFHTRILGAIE